jgi:hypothetical protein
MELTNNTMQTITARTGHVIPAEGSLRVDVSALSAIQKCPHIQSRMSAGDLTLQDDTPEPQPPLPVSREEVRQATRAELVEILLIHGFEEDELSGLTIADKDDEPGLRSMAMAAMFTEL